jgi:hypothetical protein
MHQTNNQTSKSNSDEWILLINDDDDSSHPVNIDESTGSTNTSYSPTESFNSDDALALKILDNENYDYEAQKPFVLAYPQEDNDCCYKSSTIKHLSKYNLKHKIVACVFFVGICTSIGLIIYFTDAKNRRFRNLRPS